MPKTNNPDEEAGEGAIETTFGRVTFRVVRGPNGSFIIPRGTVLTFPDGRVLGTLDHVVKLNGFTPTTVDLTGGPDRRYNFEAPSASAGFVTLLSALPEISMTGKMPVAKSAIDRLLEDDDLV